MKKNNLLTRQDRQVTLLHDHIFYPKGCIGFHERSISNDTLKAILEAVTPYVSLSEWRLVTVTRKDNRIKLLKAMQAGYRELRKEQWAETMERWKAAPVVLVFCVPAVSVRFGDIPGDVMRSMALIELGIGVQSMILMARAHGIETHWIASALLIQDIIKEVLRIPEEYEIVFFGVAGYPAEEIHQDFRQLPEVCFVEFWGNSFHD